MGLATAPLSQATLNVDLQAETLSEATVDGIYPSGAPITEESGPDRVHIGRNLGTDTVDMWVVFVNDAGAPLSVDASNPGCPFE